MDMNRENQNEELKKNGNLSQAEDNIWGDEEEVKEQLEETIARQEQDIPEDKNDTLKEEEIIPPASQELEKDEVVEEDETEELDIPESAFVSNVNNIKLDNDLLHELLDDDYQKNIFNTLSDYNAKFINGNIERLQKEIDHLNNIFEFIDEKLKSIYELESFIKTDILPNTINNDDLISVNEILQETYLIKQNMESEKIRLSVYINNTEYYLNVYTKISKSIESFNKN